MATAKLGLKITRSQGGFAFGLGVNEDTFWTRYIRDLRDDCRVLSGFEPGTRVVMLSSNQAGNLLAVVSMTESRPGEILTAWIYLPLSIAVSGDELAEVIRITGDQLAGGSPDSETLQGLFDREYPVNPVSMALYKSSGDSIAFRYYGDSCRYQLPDLLGMSISQPEYQRFKEIFFIDKASGIRAEKGSDLSNSAIQDCVVLFPPENAFGFRPFADGEAFDTPRSFTEGARVRIIWKRQGYKSVEKLIDVDKANPYVQPLSIEEVFKYVTYDSVSVKNEQFCDVDGYTLRVNNKILEKGMMLAVKEVGIHEVPVVVSCDGFNTFDGVLDLSAPVTVTLEKKTYAYTFILPIDGFEDERIQLVSEVPLDESPIHGYNTAGAPVPNVNNYLKYGPEAEDNKRRLIIGAAAGLVAGLLFGWLIASSLMSGTVDRLRSENSALRSSQMEAAALLPDSLAFVDDSLGVGVPRMEKPAPMTADGRKAEARRAADEKKAAKEAARKAKMEEKAARKAAKKARKEAEKRAAAEAKAAKAAAKERAKARKDSLERAEAAAKAAEADAKTAAKARRDSLAKAEAEAKADADRRAAEEKAEAERREAEEKAEAERKAAVVKASPDLILYLDNSAKWEKGKMESFGEVPGLWDALNARDFDKILSYEDTLEESVRFTALCKSIRELKKIPGKHFTQNYCVDPNDTEITFIGYQNKIDGKLRDLKGF